LDASLFAMPSLNLGLELKDVIAEFGGQFEVEILGRLLHLGRQPLDELSGLEIGELGQSIDGSVTGCQPTVCHSRGASYLFR
jgi:hypothetical protein